MSRDCLSPKLASRRCAGLKSATSASRRATDALADAVDETRRHQPADRRCQWKDRLGEGGQAVAEGGEKLALAEPVAQRAGEDLGDERSRLGDALDDADGECRSAEHSDEIDR